MIIIGGGVADHCLIYSVRDKCFVSAVCCGVDNVFGGESRQELAKVLGSMKCKECNAVIRDTRKDIHELEMGERL